MILAEFKKKDNYYIGFKISGHACYDEAGKDIVCASVSSAVQLTANTITDFFGINAAADASGNIMTFILTDKNIFDGSKIIESLKFHLEILSHDFLNTITIKITEV